MSDSEEDFFVQTQLPPKVIEKEEVSEYQRSLVEYFFLVTFNWDLMVPSPFQMTVCESIDVFPDHWIKGHLSEKYRQEKVKIEALGEGYFSLFCKVQKGINL